MRQMFGAVAAIMLVLPSAQAADTKEAAEAHIKALLAHFQDMGKAMEKVKEPGDVKAGVKKVKDLGDQIKKLQENDKKVDPPILNDLMKIYQKPLYDAGLKVGQEMVRIQKVEGGKELVDEVQAILKTFDKKN